ncbi:dynamin family protein [Shewanella mesophila]|uniref:dynamin family protein n=1 Tax=Shewanella mesophila TaxID=2864208 RepID=UPI001C65BC85|nr:dynamin family protein [Shewanella mesophila]QYJ85855.1 dynamin family protein [Shewanella mesophila]
MSDTDLDFDTLMNGHQQTKSTVPQKYAPVSQGQNPYLHNPQQGLELVSQLVADGNKQASYHQLLQSFDALIEQEFSTHSEHDNNSAATQTYRQLRQLKSRLDEVVAFPGIERGYTVAVGGAFSAGKSRFLNSLLGYHSLLPTDTTPTTSIPTYISQGSEDRIDALNVYGGKTQIDEDALKAICHAFHQRFNVSFGHFLQLISVERSNFHYENINFLDTPGYSKADTLSQQRTNSDETIARQQLSNVDYLIWLVDQQNGTVPQPDIEFIQSLNLEQPILFVITKADHKPAAQIQQIIDTARNDLLAAEIPIYDVIGYSSQTGTELSNSGNVLTDMLESINQGMQASTLLWQNREIFRHYQRHYETNKETLKLSLKTLNELQFDESISSDNRKHLSDMHTKTRTQLKMLSHQQASAETMLQRADELIEVLCEQLQLPLCSQPNRIQLKAMSKQQAHKQTKNYHFEALLKGSLNHLSHSGELTSLPGSVIKVTSNGISIDIKQPLEIFVPRYELEKQLNTEEWHRLFYAGCLVEVQIISDKLALISPHQVAN